MTTQKKLRCPHCDKCLGEELSGYYQTTCPGCKRIVKFYRLPNLDKARVVE